MANNQPRTTPGYISHFVPRAVGLVRWPADRESWAAGRQARAARARWSDAPPLVGHRSPCAGLLAACGRDRQIPAAVADRRLLPVEELPEMPAGVDGRPPIADLVAAAGVSERTVRNRWPAAIDTFAAQLRSAGRRVAA